MLNAKEAKKRTSEIVQKQQKQAELWVEKEWEFINEKIEEAVEKGEYETAYWWSNELLEEAGIKKQYAAEALAYKAYQLGFCQHICTKWGNNCVLRVELYWIRG